MTDPQASVVPRWDEGEDTDPQILWRPDPAWAAGSRMAALIAAIIDDWDAEIDDYDDLHEFSIDRPHEFWLTAKDVLGLEADPWGEVVLAPASDPSSGPPGVRFFPEARLSFAAHCLRGPAEDEALVWTAEGQLHRRMTRGALREAVRRCAWSLQRLGVGVGDRVAALVPHTPEAIITALAASAIGAVFSSASPDFGVDGVLERFGQITPTVLVSVEGYLHKGALLDLRPKLAAVAAGLPSLRGVLVVPYGQRPAGAEGPLGSALGPQIGAAVVQDAEALWATAPDAAQAPLAPLLLPFDHPLYVLYSSGTTGKPKCIVHGAGGTLLQHAKEHQLHCDVRPGDRVFYYTTAGWMMWNWLLSALASGATLLLFDGNPTTPDPLALLRFADVESCTLFGTSAKFIDSLRKLGARPVDSLPLTALRLVTSTGSPLSPEGFDWVAHVLKPGVQVASISGGTDIIGCFVLGNPLLPVRRGEIQCKALGMAVEVWDEEGQQLFGHTGELVCTRPFPSMPVMFWADPDGQRYHDAYFNRFPGVWCHGDWTIETDSGGFIITGRSDATLNPGGVRIGTAELYRQVEAFQEVLEAVVIGQPFDNDVRVVLFVRMAEGHALDAALEARLRSAIRTGCSPRHVPAVIVQVADIPRTKSGKITELAVLRTVMGHEVKNTEALANPEALHLYRAIPALCTPVSTTAPS